MDAETSPMSAGLDALQQTSTPDSAAARLPTSQIPEQAGVSLGSPSQLPLGSRMKFADGQTARRTSVQFVPHYKLDSNDRSQSRKNAGDATGRRLSSPPPPNQFRARVSFDTFANRDASDFSLTLNRKHRDYEYTKRSRTFLCGTDANDYSDTALEWLIDELVDDGDEVVCLRVVEKDSKEAQKWAGGGLGKEGREQGYRAEARRMLERIQGKNTEDRSINLVLEFSIGKIQETIQHMIRIYEPAILVVGTRGRSLAGFQGLMPGSVSKYCLQHSPVPVIVVRPSSKRDKKKKKRMLDPTRRGYRDILDKSEDVAEGGHILDARNRMSIVGVENLSDLGKLDAEEEARMVAEAVGYRPSQIASLADGGSLTRITSARSDASGRSVRSGRSSSFGSVASDTPDMGQLMKSPELRNLDTPPGSDSESDDEREPVPVPEYVLAQEESLRKARERAIKTAEEEIERSKWLEDRWKFRDKLKENKKGDASGGTARKESSTGSVTGAGGSDALALLDELKIEEKAARKR